MWVGELKLGLADSGIPSQLEVTVNIHENFEAVGSQVITSGSSR